MPSLAGLVRGPGVAAVPPAGRPDLAGDIRLAMDHGSLVRQQHASCGLAGPNCCVPNGIPIRGTSS
jgi:hypothetical protein